MRASLPSINLSLTTTRCHCINTNTEGGTIRLRRRSGVWRSVGISGFDSSCCRTHGFCKGDKARRSLPALIPAAVKALSWLFWISCGKPMWALEVAHVALQAPMDCPSTFGLERTHTYPPYDMLHSFIVL